MASMSISKWKHFTFPFTLLSIALLFLITNYLFFTINYNTHLQDEFQNVTSHKTLRNPEWFEALSRDIKEEEIKIGVMMNMDIPIGDESNKNTTAVKNPEWFEFVARDFRDERMKIGLVSMDGLMDRVQTRAELIKVNFNRVAESVRWSDLAPERLDENSTCPDIPMPSFGDYEHLDVVVASCGDGGGLRDVFRLQVNLVVANLLVRSGRKNNGDLIAVFVGTCDPMWEMFRCDELLWSEDNAWVYKPELTRLETLVLMPVGPCQFVPPFSRFGDKEKWRRHNNQTITTQIGNHHRRHRRQREAYVTVLHTSEDYVCGAIVLAQSIIQSNSTKDLILLADANISPESIHGLRSAGWKTKLIKRIRSPFSKKDTYNEWNYSKLRIWQLKQYDKLIFIDSDLIVNSNPDKFFAYPQMTAAGNYQKHLFNSGLMVVEPSQCTFDALMRKMVVVESYNGGDQGFLNEMWWWWHRLPAQANYLKVFVDVNDHVHWIDKDVVYAVHYTGLKPWKCFDESRDCNWDSPEWHRYASDSAHKMWWRVYRTMPEDLRPYCERDRYGDKNDTPVSSSSSPVGHPVVNKGL